MNKIKYIGLDVHKSSISIAVLDATGKLIMEVTIETQAEALLDFIRGLRGTLYVALEEGTCAAWLYSLLAPQVAKVVVCDPRQNPRRLGEKKSDRLDARKLAEWLRLGTLKPVYHGDPLEPGLRESARSYRTLVSDTTRVMNRLKALYRGRGIRCAGTRVYSPRWRGEWLEQLPPVRGAAARRAALSTIGLADAVAPGGARHHAGRESSARRPEDSAQYPGARPGAGRFVDRPAANPASLSR